LRTVKGLRLQRGDDRTAAATERKPFQWPCSMVRIV